MIGFFETIYWQAYSEAIRKYCVSDDRLYIRFEYLR